MIILYMLLKGGCHEIFEIATGINDTSGSGGKFVTGVVNICGAP
jgi:hypothetical protein